MVTFQPAALCVSKTAWAFFTSVPATSAGPRTYFCHWPCEFWPQARVVSAGLAPSPAFARVACLVQSSAAYSAWSLAAAASALPLGDGEALGMPWRWRKRTRSCSRTAWSRPSARR